MCDQIKDLNYLSKYTGNKEFTAENGGNGLKNSLEGKNGEDLYIKVPVGSRITDVARGRRFELLTDGETQRILKGGSGGLGNEHFKSSTNQSPRHAQPGFDVTEGWFILELKLLADIGLVGFPNAGKSTLLSVLSAAKPEIADYPFTTLVPNLGIVSYRDHRSFIMADIPGIIEGAADGKGLGLRFLRHIERNSILLFIIPADSHNITKEYEILLRELQKHNPELLDKERLLAISKSDMLDDELKEEISKELPTDLHSLFISSVAQKGLKELKDLIWKRLNK